MAGRVVTWQGLEFATILRHFRDGWMGWGKGLDRGKSAEGGPAGAEAHVFIGFSARLKSCPDTSCSSGGIFAQVAKSCPDTSCLSGCLFSQAVKACPDTSCGSGSIFAQVAMSCPDTPCGSGGILTQGVDWRNVCVWPGRRGQSPPVDGGLCVESGLVRLGGGVARFVAGEAVPGYVEVADDGQQEGDLDAEVVGEEAE